MPGETTKELILECALKLFSEKGYSAVSMRDLADGVGISVSTIYHYYDGKQELFRDIIFRAAEMTGKARDSFLRVLEGTQRVERGPFIEAGTRFVTGYLLNEKIDPLLRTLESERFHDPAADELWRKMLLLDPLAHEEKVFGILLERGEVRERDSAALAGEYHGIMTLGYFTGDLDRMSAALGAFYDRYFSGQGRTGDESVQKPQGRTADP